MVRTIRQPHAGGRRAMSEPDALLERIQSFNRARGGGVVVHDGRGPQPETGPNGRRSYSIADIQALRSVLDETAKTGRRYQRHRRLGEHLQVIAVVNFKGGSGKTTTAAHFAQHLALQGYRV